MLGKKLPILLKIYEKTLLFMIFNQKKCCKKLYYLAYLCKKNIKCFKIKAFLNLQKKKK